ncbi:MAG: hypothetical protein FWH20_05315 [Oscillospiraceae bacterium]|nr:hypothetical protein [Oscillospiraceae bacterium]
MKTIKILLVLCFVLAFTACSNNETSLAKETPPEFPDIDNETFSEPSNTVISSAEEWRAYLEFTSLDDFLNAYLAINEGREIGEFVQRDWVEDTRRSFENGAEKVNLIELENLYLPVGIPDNFAIRGITITENYIAIRYLPMNITIFSRDEFWSNLIQNPSFEFALTKTHFENVMDVILQDKNLTREDLIDGKYLFNSPNLFTWEIDGMLASLYIPHINQISTGEYEMSTGLDGETMIVENISEMTRFLEVEKIDLTDIAQIREVLKN